MIRERHVTTGAGRTRVLEAGAGWPVVLLHAFPLNADMWRHQLTAIGDGCRLIAPDLPGFGPAAATAPASSMEAMAAPVRDVLDALEIERAVIGGLSMGGYVTFALYSLAPERFSGIVLADTKATADTESAREGRRGLLQVARERGAAAVAEEMLPKLLGETTRRERPEVAQRVRDIVETNAVEAITGAIEAMMGRPDSTPLLDRMSFPALIAVGAEDAVTPQADAEAMQRRVPRSRLVVFPAAGHLSNMETPDTFSQALSDFLASNL